MFTANDCPFLTVVTPFNEPPSADLRLIVVWKIFSKQFLATSIPRICDEIPIDAGDTKTRSMSPTLLLPLPISPRRIVEILSPKAIGSEFGWKTTTDCGASSARSLLGSAHGDLATNSSPFTPLVTHKVCKGDFEIISVIGQGQSGTVVHLVQSKLDGEYYAMKTIDKWSLIERRNGGDWKAIERAARERNLHVELMSPPHAYFIELFRTFQTSGHLYYVLEYCPMDVFEYLSYYGPLINRKRNYQIVGTSDANLLTAMFIAELSVAVDTIHKAGSIHRDIKIDNILISVDGHVRLSDFGSSKKLGDPTSRCDSMVGFSVSIMPPEFFRGIEQKQVSNYGAAIDWYQVGICAYQVVTGRNPFLGNPLVSVDSPYYPPEWPNEAETLIHTGTRDLIMSLLHPEETLRTKSIEEVKSQLSYLPWDLVELGETKTVPAPFPLSVESLSSQNLPRMVSSGSADEFDAFDPVPLATFNYTAGATSGYSN